MSKLGTAKAQGSIVIRGTLVVTATAMLLAALIVIVKLVLSDAPLAPVRSHAKSFCYCVSFMRQSAGLSRCMWSLDS